MIEYRFTPAAPYFPSAEAIAERDVPSGFKVHPYGGGLVQNTAEVHASAFVGFTARVLGHAKVKNNAVVSHRATVSGNALVSGEAQIAHTSLVTDRAHVTGSARVTGDSVVCGTALVAGNARITGLTTVAGSSRIGDNVITEGSVTITGDSRISGLHIENRLGTGETRHLRNLHASGTTGFFHPKKGSPWVFHVWKDFLVWNKINPERRLPEIAVRPPEHRYRTIFFVESVCKYGTSTLKRDPAFTIPVATGRSVDVADYTEGHFTVKYLSPQHVGLALTIPERIEPDDLNELVRTQYLNGL